MIYSQHLLTDYTGPIQPQLLIERPFLGPFSWTSQYRHSHHAGTESVCLPRQAMAFCELYRTWPGSQWKEGRGKRRTRGENVQKKKKPSQFSLHRTCECSVKINLCGHTLGILIFISERGRWTVRKYDIYFSLWQKKARGIHKHKLWTKQIKYSESVKIL